MQARRRLSRRRNLITGAVSLAGHLVAVLALLSVRAEPPRALEPELIEVALVDTVRPFEKPTPTPSPPTPTPTPTPSVKPPAPKNVARPTPARPDVPPLAAGEGESEEAVVADLSDAQIAGAATAGSGQAGGECDMARWLQNQLRKDRLVQAAVAEAHRGKAIMVWNGDWIRRPGQDGDGLATVREAIMWEVAFAPAACRSKPVHGLVLISLNDAPGSARLVVGSERWRWSDLLFARPAVSRE